MKKKIIRFRATFEWRKICQFKNSNVRAFRSTDDGQNDWFDRNVFAFYACLQSSSFNEFEMKRAPNNSRRTFISCVHLSVDDIAFEWRHKWQVNTIEFDEDKWKSMRWERLKAIKSVVVSIERGAREEQTKVERTEAEFSRMKRATNDKRQPSRTSIFPNRRHCAIELANVAGRKSRKLCHVNE